MAGTNAINLDNVTNVTFINEVMALDAQEIETFTVEFIPTADLFSFDVRVDTNNLEVPFVVIPFRGHGISAVISETLSLTGGTGLASATIDVHRPSFVETLIYHVKGQFNPALFGISLNGEAGNTSLVDSGDLLAGTHFDMFLVPTGDAAHAAGSKGPITAALPPYVGTFESDNLAASSPA